MTSRRESKPMDWESTPLTNVLFNSTPEVSLDMSAQIFVASLARGDKGAKDFHLERLGKQKTTFTSECRYYVWEGKDWRVFAANGYGTSFEVREDISTEEAIEAWKDYLRAVGIDLEEQKLKHKALYESFTSRLR